MKRFFVFSLALAALTGALRSAEPDILVADFEGADYGAWKVEGEAFGKGPAQGTLPGQMHVSGYAGKGLLNSFVGGDRSKGKLTSVEFGIERKFMGFLIGGGGWEGATCMNLVIDGKVVRTATGPNTEPGGSEALAPSGWDVQEFAGKMARLEVIDTATGGWGHINVDQIVLTDTPQRLAPKLLSNVTREIRAEKQWLNFPVKNGARMRAVTVSAGGKIVRRLEMELADAEPEWMAPLDVSEFRGQNLVVSVNKLAEGSRALEQISLSDAFPGQETLYREALRPQFHFSARRGWLNDPNGMAFFNGEYHLFFQHSPFSWGSSLKHWGHAVSRDLVHWEEIGDKIDPDELGSIWSGSGVVDWKNTSGFGREGKPPLVLIYTAAGPKFTQCLAHSVDGRTVTKFAGNPVVGEVTHGNRDPKVFWHEPTQRWVQVLYVELKRKHTIHFFTSPNLRDWTLASVTEGGTGDDRFLFECPDFFELPIDGDATQKKWVLSAADTQYAVGTFDGTRFTAETGKLPGHRGRGYYAPQTFSDEPKGRRIQIGWLQTGTPGMPFNQSMSIPLEMRLAKTSEGPRITYTPVRELEALRGKSHVIEAVKVSEGGANPLGAIQAELVELMAEFEPGDAAEVAFNVRGVPVVYDARKQELIVNGHRAPAPLRNGKQRLTVFADRTCLEVFAGGGLTYVPMPINLKPAAKGLAVATKGGTANFLRLEAHELRSAWK